jgi:hypothetical protein
VITVVTHLTPRNIGSIRFWVTFLHVASDAVSRFVFTDLSVQRALTSKHPSARQNFCLGNIHCDFNPCAIPFKTCDFFCSSSEPFQHVCSVCHGLIISQSVRISGSNFVSTRRRKQTIFSKDPSTGFSNVTLTLIASKAKSTRSIALTGGLANRRDDRLTRDRGRGWSR